MRAFIILLFGICSVTVHAGGKGACANGHGTQGCETRFVIVLASTGDPAESGSQKDTQATVSPWQGTWAGTENSPVGMQMPVRAKIKVTHGKISGTWNVQSGGLKPITGQVDGEEASITILQGGSMIKANLVDENTFKYSGLRGYGTLSRQTETDEK